MARALSMKDFDFHNIGTKFELDEVIPKFETEEVFDENGKPVLNKDGSTRVRNTDKIIGYKYSITIRDGRFKKKSTQVTINSTDMLVDNDYIMEHDQVFVEFENLQASMVGNPMYFKADGIKLVKEL
ncbi:MAG TPA: hypothetical protein K8V28_12750 [Enterococcus gallinarum]|nr:hypothetical protein [Enterococcus gallinarum]